MKLAAAFCLALAACLPCVAQTTWTDTTPYTFTIEHALEPGPLMQASDGNFYGVLPCITSQCNGYIYQLTPAAVYTLLYSFTGGNDGEHPVGRLIEGPDGNLYGTTSLGGANGNGTVFRIPLGTSGTFTTVYTVPAFATGATTNCYTLPSHGLTLGSDGNFYITSGGGGGGCMWSVTSGGVATLDVNTAPTTDSTVTFNDVPTQGSDGNWYIPGGDGMVEWIPGSSATTFNNIGLKTDSSETDGLGVNSELVQGADGEFYFTDLTGGSGAADNYLAAKATTAGVATILYEFGNTSADALTGLFPASNGDFYGAVEAAGANSDGEIYQLTSSGGYTDVFDFDGTDGAGPYNMPLQAADGNLYGVTEFSGSESSPAPGLVWKLTASPALAAPVQMYFTPSNPTAGTAATINWSVSNAFSTTMQQCYAYGNWTGKQTGTYNSSTHVYSGSFGVTIPSSGSYNYALTCGGRESQVLAPSLLSSTIMTVSPNPQTVGGDITVDVTVSGSGPTPTGMVQLKTGSLVLNNLILKNGKASYAVGSTSPYPPGTYPVQADYTGDANYQGSQSNVVNVVLNKATVTTTLTATPNPVTPPVNVALKATVSSGAGGITPTGSVTFSVGTTSLGTFKLSGGTVSFTASTSGIPAGSYTVVGKYSGDGDHDPSQGTVTVVVK